MQYGKNKPKKACLSSNSCDRVLFFFLFFYQHVLVLGLMMSNTASNIAVPFFSNKKSFFQKVQSRTIASVNELVAPVGYSKLVAEVSHIERDLDHLLSSLKIKGQNRKDFLLYGYYCSSLLAKYYSSYGKKDKAYKYKSLSQEFDAGYRNSTDANNISADFLDKLKKDFKAPTRMVNDFEEFLSTPFHISKIRDWLGFINLNRIVFGFSRVTIKEIVLLAQQFNWFEQFDQWTGMHTDVDSMLQSLNVPVQILNALSVGVFAARFTISASMLLKHTFSPSSEESSLTTGERFQQELYKRHCIMLNDLAWGCINLFTNYSTIFKLSAPIANGLTVGFLFFDMALIVYQSYLYELDYKIKKNQYETELASYESTDVEEVLVIKEQLAALNIEREAIIRQCYFNVAGALLFISGFSATFLLATPAAIISGYFLCTLGVAMYLSSDSFKKYQEKSLILKEFQTEGADQSDALTNMQKARQDFMITMAKNVIMPMLIVSAFAVSIELAVIIAAGYIAYECTNGYFGVDRSTPTVPAVEPIAEASLPAPK